MRGRYRVRQAILGLTPGTAAIPVPATIGSFQHDDYCPDGSSTILSLPVGIRAAVYYPGLYVSYDTSSPIEMDTQDKNYPVVLYAHARRIPVCLGLGEDPRLKQMADADPTLLDITQDYTRISYMLSHVASHGCVVVVPDLGWLTYHGFAERSQVLVALYRHLKSLNASVFSGRLDLGRIMLAGHSTGGGSCLFARGDLVATEGVQPLAVGLVAPESKRGGLDMTPLAASVSPGGFLALKGTADIAVSGVDAIYTDALAPKALATIPGANHFGYTDICSPDNQVCLEYQAGAGTIPRLTQQLIGGAYLASLMRRFTRGDMSVQPYLNGSRALEELLGVIPNGLNIQIQQEGM